MFDPDLGRKMVYRLKPDEVGDWAKEVDGAKISREGGVGGW